MASILSTEDNKLASLRRRRKMASTNTQSKQKLITLKGKLIHRVDVMTADLTLKPGQILI